MIMLHRPVLFAAISPLAPGLKLKHVAKASRPVLRPRTDPRDARATSFKARVYNSAVTRLASSDRSLFASVTCPTSPLFFKRSTRYDNPLLDESR